MIIIIGINHNEKNDKILENFIVDFKPDAVCVEIDDMSLKLVKNQLAEEQINSYYSDMPSTFKLLSRYKNKAEKDSSVNWMWDSKLVYKISKDNDFEIVPIDMDKKKMYQNIEKEISIFEKLRILVNVIKSFILSNKNQKESEDYEKRFPTLKKHLIDKKNEYMAIKIKNLQNYNKILVLVGNNHLEYLKNLDVKEKVIVRHIKSLKKDSII